MSELRVLTFEVKGSQVLACRQPLGESDIVDVTAYFEHAQATVKKLQDVLTKLARKGFENPVIHGGALRDAFLGVPHKDIDILTATGWAPGADPKKCTHQICLTTAFMKEVIVDLNNALPITDARMALQRSAGDAPINSVAMGKDGVILAHRDFISHAQRGLWAVRADLDPDDRERSKRRFERVNQRYGGRLTLGQSAAPAIAYERVALVRS